MSGSLVERRGRRFGTLTPALFAAILSAMLGLATPAEAEGVFTLTSPAFKDGGWLSVKNAGNDAKNPNCVGDNVSPPLSWTNPPAKTKSYAILMFDRQGRPPEGVSHWVAYGIPKTVMSLAEGEASKPAVRYVDGKNAIGRLGYYGPCPPREAPHHYIITLFATTIAPEALGQGLSRAEVLKALAGHVVGVTEIVGKFGR